MIETLFRGMAIFIEYPALAAVVGLALLSWGRRAGRQVPVGAGIAWLLYAMYEFSIKQRWLCSGECDIRVDLLLIYPVLLIASVAAGVSLLRASRRARPDGGGAA
jgi:hypothetical protein